MPCGGPFQSLLGFSFLYSVTIKVDFGTLGSCFCFLNTLSLPFEIHFLSILVTTYMLFTSPFFTTLFKCAIPEEFQISPILCRGYAVAKPNDVIYIGKFEECFEIN
jgi:drug/metabolite transporter (DMT)-like permease